MEMKVGLYEIEHCALVKISSVRIESWPPNTTVLAMKKH